MTKPDTVEIRFPDDTEVQVRRSESGYQFVVANCIIAFWNPTEQNATLQRIQRKAWNAAVDETFQLLKEALQEKFNEGFWAKEI